MSGVRVQWLIYELLQLVRDIHVGIRTLGPLYCEMSLSQRFDAFFIFQKGLLVYLADCNEPDRSR